MSGVVFLTKKREPDADAIRFLERALEDVRSGKTIGILLIEQDTEGGASYAVAGIKDQFAVTGYLFHALCRLQKDEKL